MRAITGFGGKVKRPEVDPPRPESRSRNRKLDEVMPWPADYFGIHEYADSTADVEPVDQRWREWKIAPQNAVYSSHRHDILLYLSNRERRYDGRSEGSIGANIASELGATKGRLTENCAALIKSTWSVRAV